MTVSQILFKTKSAFIAFPKEMETKKLYTMCKGLIVFLPIICFGLLLPLSLVLFLIASQSPSLALALEDVELYPDCSVNVKLVYIMGVVALIGIELVFDPIVSYVSSLCDHDERSKLVLPYAQLFRNARLGDVVLKLFYALVIPEKAWFGVISILFDFYIAYKWVKALKTMR